MNKFPNSYIHCLILYITLPLNHKLGAIQKKFRIWETSNLSTNGDSRTDTSFESLRDLSWKKEDKNGAVDASTRPCVHASTRPRVYAYTRPRVYAYTRPRVDTTDPRGGDGRSAATPRF